MAPVTKTHVHHVDGPMLPHLNHFSPSTSSSQSDSVVPRATTSLVPILTPPILPLNGSNSIPGNDDDNADQYILVPNTQRIVVRSAHHGKRVCDLIPESDDTNGDIIRAVALTWLPCHQAKEHGESETDDNNDDDSDEESSSDADGDDGDDGEWIILAACNNGIVQEWSIAELAGTSKSSHHGGGVGPRRSFQLTCSTMKDLDLLHLTAASNEEDTCKLLSSNGAILYGLAKGKDNDSSETATWLVKCEIPPFASSKDEEDQHLKEVAPLAVKQLVLVKNVPSSKFDGEVSQNNCVCLKKKDVIFGIMAAYRPSLDNKRMDYVLDNDDSDNTVSKGDIFVVMCSSYGLVIFRDSPQITQVDNDDSNAPQHALVHFTECMKSSQYYTKDQMSFSSMAISPGTKDLALGRANGHIDVLDNLFDNVANYFELLGKKKSLGQENSSFQEQHPEEVTVQRTVHWHAHPVRALTFFTAQSRQHSRGTSGASVNPMSLLSGGEESVLVTWQLNRNFYKPSNFVARVGQGGIVHMLCCQYSSKVIVFCSDNSVQCFNGSNYEREWAEQGLASMVLHEEEDKQQQDGPMSRGPIIMMKDPITNYPMLTNLPGAPGMVHWYNPKSASVVGTLEVAPYNRVSRRDPLADPHVPAPEVTHMAIGQNGKDMVTVDTVWTENPSVGASYDLVGPQGTTAMNVCTSIKFWSYVDSSKGGKLDQRKRRNGEVPMSYELVSSMAAPHGRDGDVCALAVAPNGSVACTLSQKEDTFRVWVKNTGTSPAGTSTLWKCLYKVKTPSGYANLLAQRASPASSQQLVAFSSDGTVLSVSYGSYVTLWDHSNATLLTSLSIDDNGAAGGVGSGIQSINFLTKNDDVMLLTTANQIGVKSPFGGVKSCYLGNDEWSFDVGSVGNDAKISDVVPLYDFKRKSGANGGFFAVSITLGSASKSVVVVISRDEQTVVCAEGTGTPLRWQVNGEVQSLFIDKCDGSFVQLLAVTKDSQMLALSCGSDASSKKGRATSSMELQSTRNARAQAPVLKVGAAKAGEEPAVKRRKISIGMPRGSESVRNTSGFEFPVLSGKFTSAFIAKSLGRSS